MPNNNNWWVKSTKRQGWVKIKLIKSLCLLPPQGVRSNLEINRIQAFLIIRFSNRFEEGEVAPIMNLISKVFSRISRSSKDRTGEIGLELRTFRVAKTKKRRCFKILVWHVPTTSLFEAALAPLEVMGESALISNPKNKCSNTKQEKKLRWQKPKNF